MLKYSTISIEMIDFMLSSCGTLHGANLIQLVRNEVFVDFIILGTVIIILASAKSIINALLGVKIVYDSKIAFCIHAVISGIFDCLMFVTFIVLLWEFV